MPRKMFRKFECVLGFGHLLFVFYSMWGLYESDIWCLDLLNGEKYKLNCVLPYDFENGDFKMIKIGNDDRINFIRGIGGNGDDGILHISIDLKDLLSRELIEKYRSRYPRLIEAMCKELGMNMVSDVAILIAQFCSKLCHV